MISIFLCESITNDKLKYEDTKFFGKEASLMVLTEVETSVMRIRLVGRRMEAEVTLKVPIYLNSFLRNQILSMRLPGAVPAGYQLMLICSLKCHLELAGEGIEYA
jgi:hypothetical protein